MYGFRLADHTSLPRAGRSHHNFFFFLSEKKISSVFSRDILFISRKYWTEFFFRGAATLSRTALGITTFSVAIKNVTLSIMRNSITTVGIAIKMQHNTISFG